MKIIAVNGSPNRKGNTSVLVEEALRGAQEAGAEVEEIFLADHHVEFCRGCLSRDTPSFCLSTGKCVVDDEMEALKGRLYGADGVILASPSYGLEPTARMKNFLTDRFGLYSVYTSAMRGKYFLGLSTAGAVGAPQVAKQLAKTFAVGFFGRGYVSGSLGVSVGHDRLDPSWKEAEPAYRLGRRLARDIRRGRRYPLQNLMNRIITRLAVRPMISRNIRDHREDRMKAVYDTLAAQGLLR